jgi:hypothetical protein
MSVELVGRLESLGSWMAGRFPWLSMELGVFTLFVVVFLRLKPFRSGRIRRIFWLLVLAKPIVLK